MAVFNIPHPSISKLPTTEVDAEPELWNKGYRQIDENMEAIKRILDQLDKELRDARGADANAAARIARIQSEFNALKTRIGNTVVNSINGKTGNVYITAGDVPELLTNGNPYMTGIPHLVGVQDWANEAETEVDNNSNQFALVSQGFIKRMMRKISERFVQTYAVGGQRFIVMGIPGARFIIGLGKATYSDHNGHASWEIGPGLNDMYNKYDPEWFVAYMTPQVGSEAKFIGGEAVGRNFRMRWIDAPIRGDKIASWMVIGICRR